MKNLVLLLTIPFLFACTKEELFPSSSLEGGVWKTACSYSASGSYQINSASFSGGGFTQSSIVHSGSGCATALARFDITGTYVVGSSLNGSNVYPIDETLASMKLTVLDSSLLSSYNSATYCGYSDWAVGVAKDVTGRTCGSSVLPSVGSVNYDIYTIWPYSIPEVGITQGTLNFGYNDTAHDGTSPSKRPESTYGNFDYVRN
jgi:hypothetical protein